MFRFSIRELLLITLVAGIGLGWWADRKTFENWKARTKALEHVLLEDGWNIEWHLDQKNKQVGKPDCVIVTKKGNDLAHDHGYNLEANRCDCGSVSFQRFASSTFNNNLSDLPLWLSLLQ